LIFRVSTGYSWVKYFTHTRPDVIRVSNPIGPTGEFLYPYPYPVGTKPAGIHTHGSNCHPYLHLGSGGHVHLPRGWRGNLNRLNRNPQPSRWNQGWEPIYCESCPCPQTQPRPPHLISHRRPCHAGRVDQRREANAGGALLPRRGYLRISSGSCIDGPRSFSRASQAEIVVQARSIAQRSIGFSVEPPLRGPLSLLHLCQ
jgi:hypothetical protein